MPQSVFFRIGFALPSFGEEGPDGSPGVGRIPLKKRGQFKPSSSDTVTNSYPWVCMVGR